VQSEHQIVAVAPPGALGTVEVTVTTPYGSSPVSEADGYTYVPGQAPGPIGAVAGALTAGGAVAPGRQVTVSGTGPANATLQTGLFCSGDCDGESLGAVSTDGGGHYTTTFTLPALTKQGTLSPYALAIGCDGCGAGWTGIPLAAATTSSTPPTVAGISPSSGPDTGGQTVTVTGSGLTTDTQAHFGTVAVPVLGATSDGTSLTVTTPPGADGRVDVTVTNGGGTSATSRATAYTYQPPVQPPLPQPPTPPAQPPLSLPPTPTATPVVTGVTPAAGPDTGGQVVTIAGSGFAADAQVTFGPYNTATVAAVSPDGKQITARTPPDLDGPMDVQVATAAGVSPLQRRPHRPVPRCRGLRRRPGARPATRPSRRICSRGASNRPRRSRRRRARPATRPSRRTRSRGVSHEPRVASNPPAQRAPPTTRARPESSSTGPQRRSKGAPPRTGRAFTSTSLTRSRRW